MVHCVCVLVLLRCEVDLCFLQVPWPVYDHSREALLGAVPGKTRSEEVPGCGED